MDTWYEVHSKDPKSDRAFRHECGELGCGAEGAPYAYESEAEARTAVENIVVEEGLDGPFTVVRLTREHVLTGKVPSRNSVPPVTWSYPGL